MRSSPMAQMPLPTKYRYTCWRNPSRSPTLTQRHSARSLAFMPAAHRRPVMMPPSGPPRLREKLEPVPEGR